MENLQRTDTALRYTVALVALLNLGYFGVEFAVALTIGSVSLFADSIDFLEDATVNGLILVALGWNARLREPSSAAASSVEIQSRADYFAAGRAVIQTRKGESL